MLIRDRQESAGDNLRVADRTSGIRRTVTRHPERRISSKPILLNRLFPTRFSKRREPATSLLLTIGGSQAFSQDVISPQDVTVDKTSTSWFIDSSFVAIPLICLSSRASVALFLPFLRLYFFVSFFRYLTWALLGFSSMRQMKCMRNTAEELVFPPSCSPNDITAL